MMKWITDTKRFALLIFICGLIAVFFSLELHKDRLLFGTDPNKFLESAVPASRYRIPNRQLYHVKFDTLGIDSTNGMVATQTKGSGADFGSHVFTRAYKHLVKMPFAGQLRNVYISSMRNDSGIVVQFIRYANNQGGLTSLDTASFDASSVDTLTSFHSIFSEGDSYRVGLFDSISVIQGINQRLEQGDWIGMKIQALRARLETTGYGASMPSAVGSTAFWKNTKVDTVGIVFEVEHF